MRCFKLKYKAQAAAELAIMGVLILIAFNAVLVYGQRYGAIQKIKMETFRRAMARAFHENMPVSLSARQDEPMTDLFSGFAAADPSTIGSSATVMWQKGMAGHQKNTKGQSEAISIYRINDTEIEMPRYERQVKPYGTDDYVTVTASAGVWQERSKTKSSISTETERIERRDGSIDNYRETSVDRTTEIAFDMRYENDDGTYSYEPGEREVEVREDEFYQRGWYTPPPQENEAVFDRGGDD